MATITTGLTYTISGRTMKLSTDKDTIVQWCTENGYTYVTHTVTAIAAAPPPCIPYEMVATYEYEPLPNRILWGWRWGKNRNTLTSVVVS